MEIRPHRTIKRKKTKKIKVGNVSIGGDSIISVQSMTNTLTTNHEATLKQIKQLEEAGVSLDKITDDLLRAGVAAFAQSYESLLTRIEEKLNKLDH